MALSNYAPDRRQKIRYAINFQVDVAWHPSNGEEICVSVSGINISENSVALEGESLPPIRSRVVIGLRVGNVPILSGVRGRVIWCTNSIGRNSCGIVFEVPLEEVDQFYRSIADAKKNAFIHERRKAARRSSELTLNASRRIIDRRSRLKFFANAFRWSKRLADVKRTGVYPYLRELESASAAEIKINNKSLIMLASNSYLGLSDHPKVVESAIAAIKQYGVGSGAARLLSGTSKLHRQLEDAIAEFKGTEAAILYSSGFLANYGLISTLVEKEDVIFIDQKVHASIVDGCMHTGAVIRVFRHNDSGDLARKLKAYGHIQRKIIIVDGVYSMDGDIADLPNIQQLAEKYGALLMVDDAHAAGVIGEKGKGTEEYFGLKDKVDISVGTFSKSFAAAGGYVCGSKELIDYLQHFSRSFVFNTSLPPAVCAAALAAIDIVRTEPERVQRLRDNGEYFRNCLKQIGFNTGLSETPIIPVLVGKESVMDQMNKFFFDNGVMVSPVGRPAVKRTEARLRINIMATHTKEQMDRALELFKIAYKRYGPFEIVSK